MVDNKVHAFSNPVHVLPTLRKMMLIWQIWPEKSRMPVIRLILLATYTIFLHVPMVILGFVSKLL